MFLWPPNLSKRERVFSKLEHNPAEGASRFEAGGGWLERAVYYTPLLHESEGRHVSDSPVQYKSTFCHMLIWLLLSQNRILLGGSAISDKKYKVELGVCLKIYFMRDIET